MSTIIPLHMLRFGKPFELGSRCKPRFLPSGISSWSFTEPTGTVLGFRRSEFAKWSALPCLFSWLAIMILIWLYLLGWAHIVSGRFSPIEIAMTLIVGLASAAGVGIALRWRTAVRPIPATAVLFLFGALQLLGFRISLLPLIAHR